MSQESGHELEICLSLWSQLTSHLGKTLLLSSLLYLLTGFSSSRVVGFSSLLVVGQRLPSVPCSWALPACFIRAREHKMPERGGTSQIEVTVFCNLVMERVPRHFTILYLLEASHWIRATLGNDTRAYTVGGRDHWKSCQKLPTTVRC